MMLEIEGLSAGYGDSRVLHGVDPYTYLVDVL